MKPKTLVTLVVAVGCGLVVAFLMKQAGSGSDAEAEATVPVLMAEMNIDLGKRILPDQVRFHNIPVSMVPEGAVTDVAQYEDRALLKPAVAGEIINVAKLGEPGIYGNSIQIPVGSRVVPIPVSESESFSGMLQPGDRVDLRVTYRKEIRDLNGDRRTVTESKPLLEYIKVFAVDNRTASSGGDQTEGGKFKNIHLIVTPEQEGWIKLAQEKGRLSTSWRSELDTEPAMTGALSDGLIEDLIGIPARGQVAAAAEDVPSYDAVEEEDTSVAETTATEPMDFRAYLSQSSSYEFTPKPTPPPAPMWTIEIRSGGESQSVTVPLDDPEAPAARAEVETDLELDNATVETAGRLLRQYVLGM